MNRRKNAGGKGVRAYSLIYSIVAGLAVIAALMIFGPADQAMAQELELTTSEQTPSLVSVEDGVYTISFEGKCLEVKAGSEDGGATLRFALAKSTPAQRWRIEQVGSGSVRIVNIATGKALCVNAKSQKSGTAVLQKKRGGSAAQRWLPVKEANGCVKLVSELFGTLALGADGKASKAPRARAFTIGSSKAKGLLLKRVEPAIADGYYTFANDASKKMLDVAGASYDDGANLQQYGKNGTLAQTYRVAYDTATGYYTIRCCGSGKALDVQDASVANGANVQQCEPSKSYSQKWSIEKVASKKVVIRSALNGKAISIEGGAAWDCANAQMQTCTGAAYQTWKIAAKKNWIANGAYFIASAKNSSRMLDIEGASQAKGANAEIYDGNETNAQRFYLRHAGGGAYTIQNTYSGLYVGPASGRAGANVRQSATRTKWVPVLANDGIVFKLKADPSTVLALKGGSAASGTNVRLSARKGTISQKWLLDDTAILADGVYRMKSLRGGFALAAPSSKSGIVKLAKVADKSSQMLEIENVSGGTYRITSVASSRVLKANVSESANAGNVSFAAKSGAASKQWTIGLAKDGGLAFKSKGGGGKGVLSVAASAPAAGSIVRLEASSGKKTQRWKVGLCTENTGDRLSISLDQIVSWNWSGNSYNAQYLGSRSALYNLMDPAQCNSHCFVDLRKTTKTTAKQLNAFIATNGSSGMLANMGSAFVAAAKKYGLNQDYLLAHAILESGWGTSELASGYYYGGGYIDGSYYPAGTYYNFYGIGAYDSSALSGGRKLAIINGWSTRKKAIYGAASWIAKNYVYRDYTPQYTLYGMKWDYLASDATKAYGWHQYATGGSWANSIAGIMGNIYASAGTGKTLAYIIPAYK